MRTGLKYAALAAFLAGCGPALADAIAPDAVSIADMEIAQSLTGSAGDPVAGREAFADRKLGNCLACHVNADLADQLFHGEVGPPLDGVADRWTPEQLRAIIVNSKEVFGEQTIMPGFYTLDVGKDVAEKFAGQTILTGEQVEDIVAYLTTLKE